MGFGRRYCGERGRKTSAGMNAVSVFLDLSVQEYGVSLNDADGAWRQEMSMVVGRLIEFFREIGIFPNVEENLPQLPASHIIHS